LDYIYKRLKERNGDIGLPEFRLPMLAVGVIALPIGLFLAGWGPQECVHCVVADIGFGLVAFGVVMNVQGMQTYVIDAFSIHTASALAAVNCLRSLAGFGFSLFARPMYSALGYGKGDTILAAFALAVGPPSVWISWIYGERIRGMSRRARKE